jgi:AcrR family transcriptional regulator
METHIESQIVKRKPGRPSTNASRRKEILEKATDCFIQFGFNKTTLDEIGEAIGFNKAALYYYFKNKEELFVQVVHNQLSIGLDKVKNDINNVQIPEEKLLSYLRTRTELYANLIRLTSLSNENILDLNSTFEEIYLPYKKGEITFIKGVLAQMNAQKSESELEAFAELILDLVNSMGLSAFLVKKINIHGNALETYNNKKNTIVKLMLKAFNA